MNKRISITAVSIFLFIGLNSLYFSCVFTQVTLSNPPYISYDHTLAAVKEELTELKGKFHRSQTPNEKTNLLNNAAKTLIRILYDQLFPYWYGTPWDFYGMSTFPQEGEIACGYFVSTLLEDAGIKVERIKMAQQASEHIIQSLVSEEYIRRYRHVPIEDFIYSVKEWGTGVYVVGLDNHVGFILNHDDVISFIHSSYVYPVKVVNETAENSIVLAYSDYRILGKLTADETFLTKWLEGKRFKTVTP